MIRSSLLLLLALGAAALLACVPGPTGVSYSSAPMRAAHHRHPHAHPHDLGAHHHHPHPHPHYTGASHHHSI